MIITIALYGTRMAHIFVQVCAWVYNGILPSLFARHRGHKYLPQTAEIFSHFTSTSMQPPPSRGMLHSPDRSGRMAYGRNKCIDQR